MPKKKTTVKSSKTRNEQLLQRFTKILIERKALEQEIANLGKEMDSIIEELSSAEFQVEELSVPEESEVSVGEDKSSKKVKATKAKTTKSTKGKAKDKGATKASAKKAEVKKTSTKAKTKAKAKKPEKKPVMIATESTASDTDSDTDSDSD